MTSLEHLQQEIDLLKQRNKKVELEKQWEESATRKVCIAILTYGVIVLFFIIVDVPNPWINALVPTIGFLLSTLSLHILKHLRIKRIR